jgi:glutathione peroxidase-family protein
MAGPKKIRWNFDTYYVVDKQGHIESFTGITPRALYDPINALLVEKEL